MEKLFDSKPIYICADRGSGKSYLIKNILTSQDLFTKIEKSKIADITDTKNIVIYHPEEDCDPFYRYFVPKECIFPELDDYNTDGFFLKEKEKNYICNYFIENDQFEQLKHNIKKDKSINWVVVFDDVFTSFKKINYNIIKTIISDNCKVIITSLIFAKGIAKIIKDSHGKIIFNSKSTDKINKFSKFINVDVHEIKNFVGKEKFWIKDYFIKENEMISNNENGQITTVTCNSNESFKKFLEFISNKDVEFNSFTVFKNSESKFTINLI